MTTNTLPVLPLRAQTHYSLYIFFYTGDKWLRVAPTITTVINDYAVMDWVPITAARYTSIICWCLVMDTIESPYIVI